MGATEHRLFRGLHEPRSLPGPTRTVRRVIPATDSTARDHRTADAPTRAVAESARPTIRCFCSKVPANLHTRRPTKIVRMNCCAQARELRRSFTDVLTLDAIAKNAALKRLKTRPRKRSKT